MRSRRRDDPGASHTWLLGPSSRGIHATLDPRIDRCRVDDRHSQWRLERQRIARRAVGRWSAAGRPQPGAAAAQCLLPAAVGCGEAAGLAARPARRFRPTDSAAISTNSGPISEPNSAWLGGTGERLGARSVLPRRPRPAGVSPRRPESSSRRRSRWIDMDPDPSASRRRHRTTEERPTGGRT